MYPALAKPLAPCRVKRFIWRDLARPAPQAGGCDDGHDTASGEFPAGACQLYEAPGGAPLAHAGRGPQFSSSTTGFMRERTPRTSAPPL